MKPPLRVPPPKTGALFACVRSIDSSSRKGYARNLRCVSPHLRRECDLHVQIGALLVEVEEDDITDYLKFLIELQKLREE